MVTLNYSSDNSNDGVTESRSNYARSPFSDKIHRPSSSFDDLSELSFHWGHTSKCISSQCFAASCFAIYVHSTKCLTTECVTAQCLAA